MGLNANASPFVPKRNNYENISIHYMNLFGDFQAIRTYFSLLEYHIRTANTDVDRERLIVTAQTISSQVRQIAIQMGTYFAEGPQKGDIRRASSGGGGTYGSADVGRKGSDASSNRHVATVSFHIDSSSVC